jgi:glycosyltransferase involved in cell wall biosynthesis
LTCAQLGNRVSKWKPSFQVNVVCHDIYSSPKLDFAQKFRLFKFLRKANDFDIIHSLFTPTKINSLFIKLALKNKKAKFIQTVATLREDLYNEGDFKKILFGDQIITYSDYAKEKLVRMGFQGVKRIYPGIDLSDYSPREKNQELMKRFETSDDDFVINFTGEYTRLGAIDDVVDSFIDLVSIVIPAEAGIQKNNGEQKKLDPRLRGDDKQGQFKLHLSVRVKNGKDAEKKEKIINKLKKENILNRVTFIDDGSYVMPDVYNLCDISIFPVRDMKGKFDIPLAVVEAMACGKPVIASNIERLKYFLNDSNSILINPGDGEALKEKILELYNDPKRRAELGSAGKEYVIQNFDIMKVVKEYEEVYKNL